MATAGEEEVEYESDPEESKRSLAMRRREAASDDEEGEEGNDAREKPRVDRRPAIHSDESDGQGGAADYDEDEEYVEDDEEAEEEGYEDEIGYEDEEIDGEDAEEGKAEEGHEDRHGGGAAEVEFAAKESEGDGRENVDEPAEMRSESRGEEEKKENEPFAVPTTGAFYMHDDRFRDNAGGRQRRTYGGRKLWESKDDRKWGHDKFEEMTAQERQYEERRRMSRGRYRGRGKTRGTDRGYSRVNRSKAYNNDNNQNHAPKSMRGRGPRRYEPTGKNNQAPAAQIKPSGRPAEKNSHPSSGRAFAPASNIDTDPVPARKQVFASSLNSASPPFYPSGSSNKDIAVAQKRDVQTVNNGRNIHPATLDENTPVQPSIALRGKSIVDSVGLDRLYIDDRISQAGAKPVPSLQMQHSGSTMASTNQSSQVRAQGRGVVMTGQMTYQPSQHQNQASRVSPSSQLHAVPRNPVQSRVQPPPQVPVQQVGQHSGIGSQVSSPPKASQPMSSFEPGESESPSESSKSKSALVRKGKGTLQGSGRGSFMYGGPQVMGSSGSMGVGHGDQNFSATPAFLPVMQFGGQHPGGIGVPAVGMAFPGYVAQPQLGLGNSEMTWLPVLAGAAGALGATYCSPYIAVDGAYHARPSGQTSSTSSSNKDTNTNKPNNELKASPRQEIVNDEFGQRQNKPRRYSEMNFGQ